MERNGKICIIVLLVAILSFGMIVGCSTKYNENTPVVSATGDVKGLDTQVGDAPNVDSISD